MSSSAKLMNSFHLFTSREIIKQQGRTNFAIRVFFCAESSIIIEIGWWWLSVQPGETGQDFQYPEREREMKDILYSRPGSPWVLKDSRKTCKWRRDAGKLVEPATIMLCPGLPWPSILGHCLPSPHLLAAPGGRLAGLGCQSARGWREYC